MGLGPVGFQLLNSVLFAIPWIVGTRFRRRFDRRRDRVARAEGRICLDCGFDLRGLETSGNCPECGAEFDAGRNRSLCSRGGF